MVDSAPPPSLQPIRPMWWVRNYQRSWWRADLLAGLTVTAICVPESLGYAGVVGLPPQTGLYCALLPALVFAFMASSPQLVVGADSATASLVAAGAVALVPATSTGYPGVVALLVLISGVLLVVMSLARLGFLADLIGRPVLTGFLSGVGVYLIITKLGAAIGLTVSGTPLEQLRGIAGSIGEVNWWCVGLTVVTVGTYLVLERFVPRSPAALVALVGASTLAAVIGATRHGVDVVGAVHAGLPEVTVPDLRLDDAVRLGSSAAGVAVVVLAQSAAVGRSFATAHQQRIDTNADLLALGAA
ncbi:MAG: SulP family inorganic anion transporter, partial [Actinomycetes bacterium]